MIRLSVPLYLASQSTRRKEILSDLVESFSVVETNCEELDSLCPNANLTALKNAYRKFISAQKRIPCSHYILITADTIVVCQNKIYGKPRSRESALETLKVLSCQTHEVITGVVIGFIQDSFQRLELFTETTEVQFNQLNELDIADYIDTKQPFDKAGSYGIQELPLGFIREIRGDFENVVGLPKQRIKQILEDLSC